MKYFKEMTLAEQTVCVCVCDELITWSDQISHQIKEWNIFSSSSVARQDTQFEREPECACAAVLARADRLFTIFFFLPLFTAFLYRRLGTVYIPSLPTTTIIIIISISHPFTGIMDLIMIWQTDRERENLAIFLVIRKVMTLCDLTYLYTLAKTLVVLVIGQKDQFACDTLGNNFCFSSTAILI